MKKPILVLSVMALLVPCLAAAQSARGNAAGKVLLIIRDAKGAQPELLETMVTKEAGVIRDTLQKAGYTVDIASPTGEPWGTATMGLRPDRKLRDVNVADYKAVVIPCLGIDSDQLHPDLAALIKVAVSKGKIVAAQNMGVHMLAKAGVLTGKKYAAIELTSPELNDGIYSGTGVVKEGNIITSGTCPGMAHMFRGVQDGTPKLMEVLIAELKAR